MPCKTKASPEEMLDQIASYLYQGVTITQAAENLPAAWVIVTP